MCKFGSDCKHMFAELIDEHTSALTFVIASHFWGHLLLQYEAVMDCLAEYLVNAPEYRVNVEYLLKI